MVHIYGEEEQSSRIIGAYTYVDVCPTAGAEPFSVCTKLFFSYIKVTLFYILFPAFQS